MDHRVACPMRIESKNFQASWRSASLGSCNGSATIESKVNATCPTVHGTGFRPSVSGSVPYRSRSVSLIGSECKPRKVTSREPGLSAYLSLITRARARKAVSHEPVLSLPSLISVAILAPSATRARQLVWRRG
eukprot:scaffold83574_cov57-Phaeocystis_antarctica.AAC.1